MQLIDISRTISVHTAVWPGDQSVESSWTMSIEDGDRVNVGAVRMSMHTATHTDAPYHFDAAALPIDEVALSPYIGPASVIDVGATDTIQPEHLASSAVPLTPRVLFRTPCSQVPTNVWPDVFPAITADAVEWLAARDVVLVGTDAPSVDPEDSKSLPAHHALGAAQIAILEHLDLSAADPGVYRLVALPLRLAGMDASPVRAILIKGEANGASG